MSPASSSCWGATPWCCGRPAWLDDPLLRETYSPQQVEEYWGTSRKQGIINRYIAREFELLRVFVQHPRQVFSREHLFKLVWGSYGDRRSVSSTKTDA